MSSYSGFISARINIDKYPVSVARNISVTHNSVWKVQTIFGYFESLAIQTVVPTYIYPAFYLQVGREQ